MGSLIGWISKGNLTRQASVQRTLLLSAIRWLCLCLEVFRKTGGSIGITHLISDGPGFDWPRAFFFFIKKIETPTS